MAPALNKTIYDPDCQRCPRLAAHLGEVRRQYPTYHAKPVAPFGELNARLLIVGLAPGMHGANATGRPFTGDHAGILLYRTLHRYGFGSQAEVFGRDDGLYLTNCRITNAVKCLPPANKPSTEEIKTCNAYLSIELRNLPPDAVILALGRIAHIAVLRGLGLKERDYTFSHGACFELPDGRRLLSSYHCSRYNTQTRRLTPDMFEAIFDRAKQLLA
jgi:uracil-DNA glycosylase family 4